MRHFLPSMVTSKPMLSWSLRAAVSILYTLGLCSAVPTCLLAAEGPPLRSGLWVTQKTSEAAADVSRFESGVRGNPHLSGICLTASWNEIEKEPGHLDFSSIDKSVEALHRVGRKYELALKPGVDTPAWVFQQGAQGFETRVSNPHRSNFGQHVRIPIPWDRVNEREFHEQGDALAEAAGGPGEMAVERRLRSEVARSLQKIYGRVGQGISEAGNLTSSRQS